MATNPAASCPPTPLQRATGVESCAIVVEKDGRVIAEHPVDVGAPVVDPHITAEPDTGLHDGDRVTVVATGLAAYTRVTVALCNPAFLGPFDYGFGGCGIGASLVTDQDGRIGPIDLTVRLSAGEFGAACPPTPTQVAAGIGACVIVVGWPGGHVVGVPVAFAPGVVAPPPDQGEIVTIEAVDPVAEVVTLRNAGTAGVDIGGWILSDLAGNVVTIAAGTSLAAGATIVIHTTQPILDDGFDAVTLFDASGNPRASKAWSIPPT